LKPLDMVCDERNVCIRFMSIFLLWRHSLWSTEQTLLTCFIYKWDANQTMVVSHFTAQ